MPPAAAQEPTVRLSLARQTPWVTPRAPELRVDVVARLRDQAPLEDLSMTLAIGAAVRSRSEYERSLAQGPPFTVFARTLEVEGTLTPEVDRVLRIDMDTSGLLTDADSLVYPASIALLSAGVPVATLFTPVLRIVPEPIVPVGLTWWTELSTGPVFDPDGRLAVTALERSVAPGGRLHAAVDALEPIASSGAHLELVVEPAMLEQLTRIADGYWRPDGSRVEPGEGAAADAAALLAALRSSAAAPSIRVIGLPFASPELPAMLRSGLGDDLVAQEAFGAELLERSLGTDGRGPVVAVARNRLDQPSMDHLAAHGATTVLASEDTVARPTQPNFFAPPPAAEVAAGTGTVALVLPDPGTQALLRSPELRDDPVRLAQAVLCELATIWREQPYPAPPTVRGLALQLPRDLPPEAWRPLATRLATAPFLEHLPAEELVRSIEPPPVVTELAEPSRARFSAGYVAALRREGAAIDAFASMLAEPSPAPERLRRNLFFAESTRYVGDEVGGRAWYDHVHRRLSTTFSRLAPAPDQRFTFTASEGTIQVALGDPGPVPMNVGVEFRSTWFRFPSGERVDVTLERPGQVVALDVAATARGRRPIRVLIVAPSGAVVAQGNILVTSTTMNRFALIITGAAALGLAALWSRRLLRRTKR
jgi:hypothetical protein